MSEEKPPVPAACSGYVDLRTDEERAEIKRKYKLELEAIDSIRQSGWAIVRSQYEEFEIVSIYPTEEEAKEALEKANKLFGDNVDCYIKKIGSWS
jgi:hypothetical protein